jgi:hypothetical protein
VVPPSGSVKAFVLFVVGEVTVVIVVARRSPK